MISILIIDDHKIFREGLSSLLKSTNRFKIVGEATNGKEALSILQIEKPDIMILDLSLPDINGLELIKIILEKYKDLKIIVLTMHKDMNIVKKAFNAGVCAYVLKENAFDDLIFSIEKVKAGKKFASEAIIEDIILKKNKSSQKSSILTIREKEVLNLIVLGLTNKEISKRLFISIKTVETHRTNIMGKLDIHRTAELVKYAIKEGLVLLSSNETK